MHKKLALLLLFLPHVTRCAAALPTSPEIVIQRSPSNDDRKCRRIHKFFHTQKPTELIGIIGWSELYLTDKAEKQHLFSSTTAEIDIFWIHPAHRCKGYGKKLLNNALQRIAQQGFSVVKLIPCPIEYPDNQAGEDKKWIALHEIVTPEKNYEARKKLLKFYTNCGFLYTPTKTTDRMVRFLTP